MGISYGGHQLLYDDPDGRIAAWLATYHPLDDIRPCAESVARRSHLAGHRARQKDGLGLPIPNYPPPPPVRVNSLYWPSGAGRWATFFAMANAETMEAILKSYRLSVRTIGSGSSSRMLKFTDGKKTLEVEMHLLAPRRVTASSSSESGESLWILPLVDVRYFWATQHAGDLPLNFALTDVATALGVTITVDPPAAAYGRLDFTEFNRRYQPAGLLIDAMCHSSGLRFVRRFNGDNIAINWTASETDHTTDNLVDYHAISGGEWYAVPVPERVTTTFRLYRDAIIQDQDWDRRASANDYYDDPIATKDYTATTHFGGTPPQGVVDDWSVTKHAAMYAVIAYGSGERATFTNDTEIQELADQVGADYYESISRQYDFVFAGIKEWKLTGWDDHVEINETTTRVQSFTSDFGCNVVGCQSEEDLIVPDECVFASANGTIPKYDLGKLGQGTAIIYECVPNVDADDVTLEDAEVEVKAFNYSEYDVAGAIILKKVDCRWVVIWAQEWAKPQTAEATP